MKLTLQNTGINRKAIVIDTPITVADLITDTPRVSDETFITAYPTLSLTGALRPEVAAEIEAKIPQSVLRSYSDILKETKGNEHIELSFVGLSKALQRTRFLEATEKLTAMSTDEASLLKLKTQIAEELNQKLNKMVSLVNRDVTEAAEGYVQNPDNIYRHIVGNTDDKVESQAEIDALDAEARELQAQINALKSKRTELTDKSHSLKQQVAINFLRERGESVIHDMLDNIILKRKEANFFGDI